jgi:putative DNA-binding protein
MPSLPEIQRAFYDAVVGGGDGGGLFAGRLDVYAEMYRARLHDVLAEQHERLVAALGDDEFRALVERYVADCPPRDPDIGRAGDRLPGWLAAERPELADLARAERLHVALVDAPDAEPLAAAALALPPGELEARRLALVPAHGFVPGLRLLVWRDDVTVRERRIDDDDEWRALAAVARGATIGELGALLPGSVDAAAHRLFQLLGRWIEDGLLGKEA